MDFDCVRFVDCSNILNLFELRVFDAVTLSTR